MLEIGFINYCTTLRYTLYGSIAYVATSGCTESKEVCGRPVGFITRTEVVKFPSFAAIAIGRSGVTPMAWAVIRPKSEEFAVSPRRPW